MEKQEPELLLARDEDCPVCAGRCAFCDRQLERRLGARGYCRRCDVTYFARGCVPGSVGVAVTSTRKRRQR